ncbi:MAG: TraR/DksA family transcriptional regulator [Pseudomonadota bacterium]
MDENSIEQYRRRLLEERASLDAEEAGTETDRKPVELDQQSVGRLSRMDALQVQAMASAQSRRRTARRAQITAALKRIDEGEFGWCLECGEPIEPRRLDFDPASAVCIACARGT